MTYYISDMREQYFKVHTSMCIVMYVGVWYVYVCICHCINFCSQLFLEHGKHQRLGYCQSSLHTMSHFLLLSNPIRVDVVILHVEQAPDSICIQHGMQHEAHIELRQGGLAIFYSKVDSSE